MGALIISNADYAAACLIVAGMVCQLLHRRLPSGLGTSLFVAATTVGLSIATANRVWPLPRIEYLWLRLTAGLCLAWSFFGWLATRSDDQTAPDAISPAATFLAWSMVTGIGAAVQVLYLLVFHTWYRLVEPETLGEGLLWRAGLWDLSALFGAVFLWRAVARRPSQPVVLLTLAAFAIWWTSLTIPAAYGIYGEPRANPGLLRPAWWDWTFHLQFSLALLLAAAALMQDVGYRARRKEAWPDRLDDLLAPYSRWPAYIQVESTIVAVILVLGVYQLVRHGSPSFALGLASTSACLMAGTTCMFMAYRRWSGNTTSVGMALLTLGVVVLASTLAIPFLSAKDDLGYAARMPIVFNAILFALAFMIALWSWLARFWNQQLLDGVPWTTAGRMIPIARQIAFLLGALAVLVAFQMALWPKLVLIDEEDRGAGRMVGGLIAIAMLVLILLRRARREQKATVAGLAVAMGLSALAFIFVRMPSSALRGWIIQHDEVVLGCAALPILAVAEALPRTSWRALAGPLWLLALLVLPAWALMELLRPPLPAQWVQPMVLAVLGALYSFAGSRERRRMFLVLGGMLLLASLTSLYRAYG